MTYYKTKSDKQFQAKLNIKFEFKYNLLSFFSSSLTFNGAYYTGNLIRFIIK